MDHSPYFDKTLTKLYCYFGMVFSEHRHFILQLILKIKRDYCKQLHQSLICHVSNEYCRWKFTCFLFTAMAYLGLPWIRNINYSGCDSYVTSWSIYSTWSMERS